MSERPERTAHSTAALGHPPAPADRVGLLLLNLGTPDATDYRSMRRYLKEFLSDRRVIEPPPARWLWFLILNVLVLSRRPFRSGAAYREIWNDELDESPLLTTTRAQTHALAAELSDRGLGGIEVAFAMRYGNPSIASRVRELHERGCRRLLCLALYPQYAAPTTATAYDQVFRALMAERWQPAVRTAPPYYDHPKYVAALAGSVRAHLVERGAAPGAVVASYHGMPVRYCEAGDPYPDHCQETSRLLGEALGPNAPRIETTFQSVFGREEWLRPYTVERVAELARTGTRDIAVIAPGFAADCVETLEEIDGEIRDAFVAAGGERFTRIPCLNDALAHIELLADLAERDLAGWI